MKRNLLILSVLTLTVLFWAFSAVPTSALDGKNYPGVMGFSVPYNNDSNLIRRYYDGGIENSSSSQKLEVILPVVKDTINNGINHGWVKVLDKHSSQDILCQLISRTQIGNSYYQRYLTKSSSGYGSGAQNISFGSLVSQTSQNHYYYKCFIPPVDTGRSAILSYHVDENN